MVVVAPITIAGRRPKKPKAMMPSTTPTPMIASSSTSSAQAPSSGISWKRTGRNTASAAITEIVKALFVTFFQ